LYYIYTHKQHNTFISSFSEYYVVLDPLLFISIIINHFIYYVTFNDIKTINYKNPMLRFMFKNRSKHETLMTLLVCNWPHFVGQNHFFEMILFNRDSTIQKCFQKILHSLQVKKFNSLPAVRTACHTVRTPSCPQHHSFGRREISVRTFL